MKYSCVKRLIPAQPRNKYYTGKMSNVAISNIVSLSTPTTTTPTSSDVDVSATTIYRLFIPQLVVKKDRLGTLDTEGVTVYSQQVEGTSVSAYQGGISYRVYTNGWGSWITPSTQNGSVYIALDTSFSKIEVKLVVDSSVVDTQTIIIVSDGANGTDGNDGENAITYKLFVPQLVVKKDKNGNLDVDGVTIFSQKIVGATISSYSGGISYRFYKTAWGSWITPTQNGSIYIALDSTWKKIEVRLLVGGTQVDSQTIMIVSDGVDGVAGARGQSPVNRGEWKANESYVNDADRYDIVIVKNNNTISCYKCLQSHTSSTTLDYTNTDYWLQADYFQFVATDLLLSRKIAAEEINVGSIKADSILAYYSNGSPALAINLDGLGWIRSYAIDGAYMELGHGVLRNYNSEGVLQWQIGSSPNFVTSVQPYYIEHKLVQYMTPFFIKVDSVLEGDTYNEYRCGNASTNAYDKLYLNDTWSTANMITNVSPSNYIADGKYCEENYTYKDVNNNNGTITRTYYRTAYTFASGRKTSTTTVTWTKTINEVEPIQP
jgi:hypothetical protein